MGFHTILAAIRIAIVINGLIIAYLCYKAYKREKLVEFTLLTIAFTLITVGILIEGILFEFFRMSLVDVHTFESLVTAVGYIIILYAIYRIR